MEVHLLATAVFTAALFAAPPSAVAGPTWDGGGANTNINTAANWDGDTAPDLASGTSTLSFATGGALATLNISADVRRILFNSQVPFAIAPGGGTLTLRGENVSGLTTGLTALPWSPFGGVGYAISAPITLSGSQAWNVVNGTGPTSVVVSSGIAGTGGLSKWGSGTLVLTGSNSYSGGTTITGGTLQLGNGLAGGTLTGAVVNNSVLAFNTGIFTPTTFANQLSGTGAFVKTGGGTVLLDNAANSFTGSTTVNNGVLLIRDGAALGSTPSVNVSGTFFPFGNPFTPQGIYGQLAVHSVGGTTITQDLTLAGFGGGRTRNLGLSANGIEAFGGALLTAGNVTVTGSISVSSTMDTGISTTYGLLTLGGPITTVAGRQLGFGQLAASLAASSSGYEAVANIRVDGQIAGGGTVTQNGRGTLILTNTTNSIAAVKLFGGRVRVSNGLVLGGTAIWSDQNRGYGTLEVRTSSADIPTFSNVTLNANASYVGMRVFVDNSGNGEIGQTVTFGDLVLGQQTFRDVQFLGRNGFGVTVGKTGSNIGWTTTDRLVDNFMSGTLTIHGNPTSTGNIPYTLRAYGDAVMTGTFIRDGAGTAGFTKNIGLGTLRLTGTGSSITGDTRVEAGTLEISTASVLPSGLINIGSGTIPATLRYLGGAGTGAGETISRTLNLAGTTGGASIYADQAGTAPSRLLFNGPVTATGVGVKTFVLGGSNTLDNEIASAIPNSSSATSIQKIGAGTWVLSGANTLTGSTSVSGGLLKLQDTFAGSSRNILPNAGAVGFTVDVLSNRAGGTLSYLGGAGASAETVGALVPVAGAGQIVATGSGSDTATLTFASLGTRTAGATLDLAPGTGGSIAFSSGPAGTNGILAGWATFAGVDWVNSGESATRYTTYTDLDGQPSSATTNFRLPSGSVSTGGAFSVNSLKVVGTSGTTALSLGGTLTNTTGGVLFDNSAGAATIGGSQLGANNAELIISTGGTGAATDVLTVSSAVGGGTGSLTKAGPGTLVLTAANAYTGNTTINEGTLQLSGATATLGAITTAANKTTLRQNATLDVNAAGSGATVMIGLLDGAGTVTNSGAGDGTAATLSIGNATTTTGIGSFTGLLQDGDGVLNVTKAGGLTSTQYLAADNTYTGVTTLASGTLSVLRLANIGTASGIGAGIATTDDTNAASLVFAGGALRYTGADATAFQATQTPSVSTNRLFTIASSGTIESAGTRGNAQLLAAVSNTSAALVFSNTGAVRFTGSENRTLTLAGNSTGDNQIRLALVDPSSNTFGLSKSGTGLWIVSNTANSYSGPTTISGGILQVGNDGSAATRTLPTSSNVVISGNGVLQTTGTFTRALGTAQNQVQFTGGGGFAAGSADLLVNIGGDNRELTWGSGSFTSNNLYLNSITSLATVELTNPIDLGASQRTLIVYNNLEATTDYGHLSGAIRGSGGITKGHYVAAVWPGALRLSGGNTYTGETRIESGPLIVEAIGGTGVTASNLGGPTATVLIGVNNNQQGGQLVYIGPGESSDRLIGINRVFNAVVGYAPAILNNGSGPLRLSNVLNTVVSSSTKTLMLGGQYVGDNEVSSVLADNGAPLGVQIEKESSWILSGNNTYSGTTRIMNGGKIGIGHNNALGSSLISDDSTDASTSFTLAAIGGQRTIANNVGLRDGNHRPYFTGEHSLTLTGTYGLSNVAGRDHTITNDIGGGSRLTLSGSMGMNVNVLFTGTGDTLFNGILSSTVASRTLTYNGTGTLTLAGSYAGTPYSARSDGGALIFESASAIPGTGATVTSNAAGTVATSYAIDQSFIGRMVNTSAGVVALAANSSNPLNFSNSGGGANLTAASLGAVGSASYDGLLTPNGTTYRLGGGGGTLTFSGTLSGASNVLDVGGNVAGVGGTVILTSTANAFTSRTTIRTGRLQIDSIGDWGAGPSLLGSQSTADNGRIDFGSGASSGTLRYTGPGHATNRAVNLAGTTGGAILDAGGSGAIEFTVATRATGNGVKTLTLTGTSMANNRIGAIMNDSGLATVVSLDKTGPGRWLLTSATSTYSGTTRILGGELVLGVDAPFSGSGAFGPASLPVLGDASDGAGGSAALLLADDRAIGREVVVAALGQGATQLAILGGAGAGTSYFQNDIRLNRGVTLQAAALGTARFDSEWYVGSALAPGAGSYAFGIGTEGNTGTVELGNNLTTSGAVSVNFGRLHIDELGTLGGGGSAVTVYSGATLSGVGTVAKPVVVFSGGILSPGSSPGELTLSDGLTLTSGAVSLFELENTSTFDRLLTSDITFGGMLDVVLYESGPAFAEGNTFDLFDWSGTALGTFSQINLPTLSGGLEWQTFAAPGGGSSTFDYSTGQIVVVVPEPAAWALLAMAAACTALRGTRRRASRT